MALGEEIPNALYIFLGIYIILLLIASIFIQRYYIRKNSSIFINIFCVFIWFSTLVMIIIFPLDLFQDSIFENNEENKGKTKLFSEFLYWNFYICGFLVVDNLKSYLEDGNFTVTTKLLSCIKGMGIFLIVFAGFGFVLNLLLQFIKFIFNDENEEDFLSITIKIIQTVIGMPMIIAYLMFLGCGIGDMPRDLYNKYNYTRRNKRLCWDITHAMRKYKNETEFLFLSINKIKLTQEKIKNTSLEDLNNEIKEAKDKMNQENNEEEKKTKKKNYDNLNGLKELYKCENEMNEMLEKLESTVKAFNLNIPLETIDKNDEKRVLKNKKELVNIHGNYKIYCTQIYRLNYQKYSIYKEWAEIKTFLQQKELINKPILTEQSEDISNNNNDIKIDIEEQNNIEKKQIQKFEFQKIPLNNKQIMYYKYMPAVSIILIVFCLIYGILMIIGELEFTFGWDAITGQFYRWLFTNVWIIIPIRLFPMYFTLYAVSYSFTSIKSDIIFCVYGNRQTEPCHMLFFVGMLAKLICPLCYNFIEITHNLDHKEEHKNDMNFNSTYETKITKYFEEEFGFLKEDNIVIFVSKLVLLLLFLKAIVLNLTGCYGNFAYKKNQYLSYNANYLEKELEIMEGEEILNNFNKKYGSNLEQLKADNIFE